MNIEKGHLSKEIGMQYILKGALISGEMGNKAFMKTGRKLLFLKRERGYLSKDKCTFNKDNGAFIKDEIYVLLKRKKDTYQKERALIKKE